MRRPGLQAFIGTYTVGTRSRGIYAVDFSVDRDAADDPSCVAAQKNPAFLLANAPANILYAVEETYGDSKEEGAVWSYRICDDYRLDPLNRIGSLGVGPCCLSLDLQKRTLLTANFHSGSLTSIRLCKDGSLGDIASHVELTGSGPHPERQTSSHPHAILSVPGTDYLIVTDLGADNLSVFAFDEVRGVISRQPVAVQRFAPGFGPRHLTLHPGHPYLYVIHEIAAVVTMHHLGVPGFVSPPLQTVPLCAPDSSTIADAADIILDSVNNRLYASVRQTASLLCFSIDPGTGWLTQAEQFSSEGSSPHALSLGDSGNILLAANLQGNTVAAFQTRVDTEPKLLTLKKIPSPASIATL